MQATNLFSISSEISFNAGSFTMPTSIVGFGMPIFVVPFS